MLIITVAQITKHRLKPMQDRSGLRTPSRSPAVLLSYRNPFPASLPRIVMKHRNHLYHDFCVSGRQSDARF